MIKGGIGFQLPILAAHPAAAQNGTIVLYRLNDGKLYGIDETGVSTEIGIANHGALSGLADNDHPQYALLTANTNTFQPLTDSATVFAIGNSAGTLVVFKIDTMSGKVVIDGDIEVSGSVTCASLRNTT